MRSAPVRFERPFAAARRAAGLDLHRAAIRLRVNPQYLRSLELGRGPLSMALAQRMAAEYDCTIQVLTRPVGAGGTGVEGREASGNASRSAVKRRRRV